MPLPAVYDVIFALLIILPMGFIFSSSAFLYNKLCEKELLSLEEGTELKPIKKLWNFIAVFGFGFAISCIFYYLITNDAFDFTLIALIPPLFVAIMCELKNGFSPPVSAFFMGLCVIARTVYYCIFHGISYGVSIVLSFALVFALVFLPKFLLRKSDNKPLEITSILIFSLMGSYFSPLYALIYITSAYFILTLGYEIPNYIARKHKDTPIFTFRVPLILVGTAIFAVMLFI